MKVLNLTEAGEFSKKHNIRDLQSRNTIKKYIDKGKLPAIKTGAGNKPRYVIKMDDFLKFLEDNAGFTP
jgi:hypothetical protein